eukprot:TRINITY_DN1229_c0_g2_i1.p1 TRINITY_DN1229_c0_g2~~TRINITY_DN1229_c0_g2_i1.p1  ORF type:complete len:171 (+),score=60.33 TRINITY_DN1229_c0_g2_i1:627-1139(+)
MFREYDESTAIFKAAQNGHSGCVSQLIQAKADINKAEQNSGWTPMFAAAAEGHASCVELLIKAGADVDKMNRAQATPLWYASKQGHDVIVDMLIKAGANVNVTIDDEGSTPFAIAGKEGHATTMFQLWKSGADCSGVDADAVQGEDCVQLLMEIGKGEVEENVWLEKMGA